MATQLSSGVNPPQPSTPWLPCRYTYGETLARWRTADLLIGLAYLCRKVGGRNAAALQPRDSSMRETLPLKRRPRRCRLAAS